MKKNITKNMAPRVPESAIDFYAQTWPSGNAGAEWVLSAFPGMYRAALSEMRERFTAGELSMLIDAANGGALMIPGGQVGLSLVLSVEDMFRVYPGRYETQWGIVSTDMMSKMDSLNRFQLACLEIWAGSFWEHDNHNAEDAIERHSAILL